MGTIRPTRNSALAFTHANDHGRIFLIGEAVGWSASARRRDFGPGIAQSNRAIKHEPAGLRIRVRAEIALALELHDFACFQLCKCRLEASLGEYFQRIRIELRGEIAGVRVRPIE